MKNYRSRLSFCDNFQSFLHQRRFEITPENMIEWLKNPPAIDHKTEMPNLKLDDENARDIASYLYSLD